MHLPIYVSARRPRFQITYNCPTLNWAGQKLRDFRLSDYDEIEARDGMRVPISAAGMDMLAALPSPNGA